MDLSCIGLQPWWGYIYSWVNVLMYCRCMFDDTLRSSWLLPWSDNLIYQSSRLSYPSSLMIWGAFCYTQNLSPACDRIPNTRHFPSNPKLEENPALGVDSNIQNCSTALTLKQIRGTLFSTTLVVWEPGSANAFNLCCWCGSYPSPLCHKGV